MDRRVFLIASLAPLALASRAAGQASGDRTWPFRKPESYDITTPDAVREEKFLTLGGVEQWVSIRGRSRANPVLLLLGATGGGPGAVNTLNLQARLAWEEYFTVVAWDPRGSGRTFIRSGKEKAAQDLTMERIVADGLELTDHLRQTLGKRRIGLLGIFYGTTLAQKMVRARPNAFSVLTLDGLVANSAREREQYYFDRLKALATAAGDGEALRDLEYSGPFVWDPGADREKRLKLSAVYRKYRPPNPRFNGAPPPWTLAEAAAVRDGMILGDEKLLPEWKTYDFASLPAAFDMPVVVITGADNLFAPTPFARAWLQKVKAPRKAFHAIAGAGNHAMETHPEAYLDILRREVRPHAVARERV